MSRRCAARWLLAAVLGVVGGLVPVLAPTTAQAAGPVRILLTGDSITQGFDGDYTWRLRLWQEFQRQGVPVDLVGSQHLPYVEPGFSTSSYLDPHFDQDHFAFGGRQLGWLADQIGPEVATQQPDVVVVEAGVNDLRWHQTPDQTLASLRAFVANVRAAKPDTRIIVSPVLGAVEPGMPWLPGVIAAYDALLPAAVADLTTAESPVTLASTDVGWSPSVDSYYGLHPNPTGETLIAQRIAETLEQIGILPQPPEVFRALPWLRNLRALARVHRHTVRLSWDPQALTGVRIWLAGTGRGSQHGRFVARRGKVGRSVLRGLPRGRYVVRLVAIRHQMRSPLGPAVRFRIR